MGTMTIRQDGANQKDWVYESIAGKNFIIFDKIQSKCDEKSMAQL